MRLPNPLRGTVKALRGRGAFDPSHQAPLVGAALARVGTNVVAQPWRAAQATTQFATRVAAAGAASAALALGTDVNPPVPAPPKDRRFADPAWGKNPFFFGANQVYLAWADYLRTLAAVPGANNDGDKGSFAVDAIIAALAPTNFLPTNPVALRKAVETKGSSVLYGLRNFFDDVADNGGRPRQVDRSKFQVGKDLAATPGEVVFRNDLMELIQYAPQTETVHEVPLLLSPPWINKYYIMDLAPERSFVEWAVTRGHTVFAISYRNADGSMRDVTLDDYLLKGPRAALDVIADVTGCDEVNVVGLCVGGTLAVALNAWLAAEGDRRIRSTTLLNTLVDFSNPGPLAAFTDAETVERLEKRMAERGVLTAAEMSATFDSLRPNDLIWNYVASNWLMGEPAPAFDILAWNADSTNVPAATHSFYLRSCYLENRLARSEMTLAGRKLALDDVGGDVYVLAAQEDHITPWKSSYRTTNLVKSPVKFVLTSSGHIAGVVNPPSPKRKHWTGADEFPADPDEWLAKAEEHQGSWWEDWAEWIADRGGERREPPPMGSKKYPPAGPAPGAYVLAGSGMGAVPAGRRSNGNGNGRGKNADGPKHETARKKNDARRSTR